MQETVSVPLTEAELRHLITLLAARYTPAPVIPVSPLDENLITTLTQYLEHFPHAKSE